MLKLYHQHKFVYEKKLSVYIHKGTLMLVKHWPMQNNLQIYIQYVIKRVPYLNY